MKRITNCEFCKNNKNTTDSYPCNLCTNFEWYKDIRKIKIVDNETVLEKITEKLAKKLKTLKTDGKTTVFLSKEELEIIVNSLKEYGK